jgi:hypothetical protein
MWILFEFEVSPDKIRRGRTMSGETGQSPIGAFVLGVLSGDGICSNLYLHFILHTPLNSTVYLNSKKHKNYL